MLPKISPTNITIPANASSIDLAYEGVEEFKVTSKGRKKASDLSLVPFVVYRSSDLLKLFPPYFRNIKSSLFSFDTCLGVAK